MKKTIVLMSLVVVAATGCQDGQTQHIDTSKPTEMGNQLDSVSYALGIGYGSWLKTNFQLKHMANKAFLSGVQRSLDGMESEISKEDEKALMQGFMAELAKIDEENRKAEDAELELKHADRRVASEKWLAEMKAQPGVVEIQPGLFYKVLKEGSGVQPKDGDQVKVLYTGKLPDGTIFDTTSEDGEPRTFGVNRVIPGWTRALKEMPVGSTWEIYIASDLGYGLRPRPGGAIQPNDALKFEVELLDVITPPSATP